MESLFNYYNIDEYLRDKIYYELWKINMIDVINEFNKYKYIFVCKMFHSFQKTKIPSNSIYTDVNKPNVWFCEYCGKFYSNW